ncbi:hypothetical protein QJQ45_028753 [Haematococcus lacustris]|nr:hypothetical protein QJQ45_028753 [Haematococcus lacustris]
MRLHGAQEKVLERYFKKVEMSRDVMRIVCLVCHAAVGGGSQQQWGTRKQLVVFTGNAGIGTRGGWGAKAVLQACRNVPPRSAPPPAKRSEHTKAEQDAKPTKPAEGKAVIDSVKSVIDTVKPTPSAPDSGNWMDQYTSAAMNLDSPRAHKNRGPPFFASIMAVVHWLGG